MTRLTLPAAFGIAVLTWASGALAQGPASAKPDLAAQLKTAMDKAEASATAAFFPRANVLNAVSQSMWQTFYKSPASADEQLAAVEAVGRAELTPIKREAVDRMKVELTLN